MIYLDNSATTYPKPLSVRRKMAQALEPVSYTHLTLPTTNIV